MSADRAVWAIVVAAGRGIRMRSELPKQYLSFQGKTIIEHCLDRLLSHSEVAGAILVLSPGDIGWRALDYRASKPVECVNGGGARQESVLNGARALEARCGDDVFALVHDAVRPLVSHVDISNVIEAARRQADGAILAARVTDTLKQQDENGCIAATVAREGLWRAQTPQVFALKLLLAALARADERGEIMTDDAQALERLGYAPLLVESRANNIKITTPGDLALAESIWLHQCDQQDDE